MKRYPETLAIRAVNQYRKRDIIGYIGLRLYLECRCSIRDSWINNIVTQLTLDESESCYHGSQHFKDRLDNSTFEYRHLDIPLPVEILSEAVLLDVCAMAGAAFSRRECVFSYCLADKGDRSGMFVPYFKGYRERHKAVARACTLCPDGVVVYTDISKFYPSVTTEHLVRVWNRYATSSNLPKWAVGLGFNLISKYTAVPGESHKGLRTGPMFAHVLANLVLSDVDAEMQQLLPNGYFRYVDDVILVGNVADVAGAEARLDELVKGLGLRHNPDKRLSVTAGNWLAGECDFEEESGGASWKMFIGGIRQLQIVQPWNEDKLKKAFSTAGFRIDLVRYSTEAFEHDYLARLRHLMTKKHILRMIRMKDSASVVTIGLIIRNRYMELVVEAFLGLDGLAGYDRKRRLQKLRLYASRLVYLAAYEDLARLALNYGRVRELELFSVIFEALANADVSRLVLYGASAAQAAAQPLKSMERPIRLCVASWSEASLQARAVLLAYGLQLDEDGCADVPQHHMSIFCEWGENREALFDKSSSFFSQLAYLHGQTPGRRLEGLLSQAFDEDEDLVFEMETLVLESS